MPRANKRAQRQQEEEELWASKTKAIDLPPKPESEAEAEASDVDEESEPEIVSKPKQNVFDLLEAQVDDEPEDEDYESDEPAEESTPRPSTSATKKPKKKKKKGKGKAKADELEPHNQGDEIDAALKQLDKNSKPISNATAVKPASRATVSAASGLAALLHIDSKHLDVDHEMRRLFGRAAVAGRDEDDPDRRRRGIVPQARGRGVTQGIKKNVFVQPGEGWPVGGSGGLGMELIQRNADGTVEFRYVHSRTYQDVQRQFMACVQSMDPERMVQLLHHNPYHISTCLQVSHIALTQNNPPDHTSSQILIARALFSMGRSTHSVFPQTLAGGQARLDFTYFENRELFFAGWRYITSLERRGMWRTGLEMVRTLLQFDPVGDPLCMALCVDQYCLKARQPQTLIDLATTPTLSRIWKKLPNIVYSLPLAYFQLKDTETAKMALREAIELFPWIIPKLYDSLSLTSMPTAFLPMKLTSKEDMLLAEMYIHRSSESWGIPEATALLVEVVGPMKTVTEKGISTRPFFTKKKMRDVARHVLLTDVPALISYLPREIISDPGMAFDILPPKDGISTYEKEMNSAPAATSGAAPAGGEEMGLIQAFLRSFMPGFAAPAPGVAGPAGEDADAQHEFEAGMQDEMQLMATQLAALPPAGRREFLEQMQMAQQHFGNFGEGEGEGEGGPPPSPAQPQNQVQEPARTRHVSVEETEDEEGEEERAAREARSIEQLCSMLRNGSGDLQFRVDRMFDGREDMAEVRRKVEERLGLR